MAIVVEEEKNRANIGRLVIWAAVIIILVAAVYYLFFAAPDLVVISPPANFQNIDPLAQVNLRPDEVLNSGAFRALQPPSFALPTPTGPAAVGRTNPIVAP